MQRGKRKYQCFECGEESFHHWIEKNRASRLKCPACGSIRMDIVTEDGRREAIHTQKMGKIASEYNGFCGPGK